MVISGKNMEKSGKFQVNENKLIILCEVPQFPWKLPEISLWKVHNLPVVKTMENPVKKPVKPVNEPVKSVTPADKPVKYRVKPVNTMENLSSLEPVKIGLLSNVLRIQEVFRQTLW